MKHHLFLQEQLRNSAESFHWAVGQVPVERHYLTPPQPTWLGEWPLARYVFHLLYYEQYLALAQVQECAGQPITYKRDPEQEDAQEQAWQREQRGVESMLAEFQRTRQTLLTLLAAFDEKAWEIPRDETPFGGFITLNWYVTKAYQHTCEHTHHVLGLTLFWDFAAYNDQQKVANQ